MYLKRMTVKSTNNKNEDVIIWAADVNIFIPKFIFLCFVKEALIKSSILKHQNCYRQYTLNTYRQQKLQKLNDLVAKGYLWRYYKELCH